MWQIHKGPDLRTIIASRSQTPQITSKQPKSLAKPVVFQPRLGVGIEWRWPRAGGKEPTETKESILGEGKFK